MFYTLHPSPLGQIRILSNGNAITGLYLDTQHYPETDLVGNDNLPVFTQIREWLDGYFRGERPAIEGLPLSPAGTKFQMQVWDILRRIPYGETVTYGDIAKEIALLAGKKTMSAQAVGQAVGRNPISIIVPCHRVVGANRKLTGYAGGLDKKIRLLRHEGWLKEEEA